MRMDLEVHKNVPYLPEKACRVIHDHIPDESYVEALPGAKMGDAEESEGDGIAGSSAN